MAFYMEKDFFEDVELFNLTQRVMQGDLTLRWFDPKTERVRLTPKDPARGLTYEDCNVGSYGYDRLPELIRNNYSMAPRGSELWGKLPDLGYTINRKSEVWSDNVSALYEEAKTRRWAPAVDIAWDALAQAPLPAALETAMAQLCTFLQECATVAMGAASRWIYSINQEFLELKSYLCAQIFDQARHLEALRKRTLAGGQGLKRASVAAEQALKELLSAETYTETSVGSNLLLGSVLLSLHRYLAAVALSPMDRRLFSLMMQDTARMVAYGSGHLRYYLMHQPHQADFLHDYLDGAEHCLLGLIGSQECLEPLIVLSGGGTEPQQLRRGGQAVLGFLARLVAEYGERCEHAGLRGRSARSRLATFLRQLEG
ncbi:MAG: hypothetical protein HYZ50_03695 [Deltaproteobacteria bacterium]|nr:hypothetical protein [Deltaproteobacteria bacterium]